MGQFNAVIARNALLIGAAALHTAIGFTTQAMVKGDR
jgi:hypothetical protein